MIYPDILVRSGKATIVILLSLSLAGLFSCTKKTETPEKPNVLFIAVDDLRPELNCYGNNLIRSPNIDRLAESGTLFNRAYCNVPVCGASRASLLTGTRPTRYRFLDYDTWTDEDLPDVVTLPQHFRNNGYHTISLGKIFHHQYDRRESWDENWRPKMKTSPRDYQVPENIALDTVNGQRGMPYESAPVNDTTYFDGRIAARAISHLTAMKESGEPFFLAVGFLKPHLPFNAPSKYWELYDYDQFELPDNYIPSPSIPKKALHNWGELRAYHGIPSEGPLSDSLALKLIQGYYACVSYTDAQIGNVLNTLKDLGLDKNTIVVLWGDHGWNLGEHGLWCKHCNFNTSLRTPLIFRVPGMTQGDQTNALVEFIDIYPTLCELANLSLPEHLEGKSVVPLLKNPQQEGKDFIISKWFDGLTIKTRKYAYTEWGDENDSIYERMLFDHEQDIEENSNLAGMPEYEENIEELSITLHQNRGEDFLEPVASGE